MTSTLKQSLARRMGRIPDPVNYHKGIPLPELNMPREINMFPRPRTTTQFYHEPKIHLVRYVLAMVLDGSGCVSLNNELYPLQRDTALLIFPGQLHYYVNLQVRPRQWLFITFELTSNRALVNLRDTPVRVDARMWRLADTMVRDYLAPSRKSPERAGGMAHNLWLLLLYLASEQAHNPYKPSTDLGGDRADYDFLLKVQEYVAQHHCEHIRVEDIARHTGMSRSLLQSRFSALMGTGIAGYIRGHRLKHSTHLMATTPKTMSEIATACGFNSLYTFSRTFKNVYGVSPTDYCRRISM